MAGATVTASAPDVAPGGTVASMLVLLQELMVRGAPLSSARLPFWGTPKLAPVMVTELPMDPVVAESVLMLGTGAAAEVMETLSKVAVASEAEPLLAARPRYTLAAMAMVWVEPSCTQLTPSSAA